MVSVREMKQGDIELIVDYFLQASPEFLKRMGADKSKLPSRSAWIKKLQSEYEKPYSSKEFYYIIWLLDGNPIGHSNINNIDYRNTAKIHLHLWKIKNTKSGLGYKFLKKSIPFYFYNFKLEKLICEPYSKNKGPNRLLKKIGFNFIKAYETIPGWINFNQIVNRYELTKEHYEKDSINNWS